MVSFSRRSHNALARWLWTIDKVILFVSLALLIIGFVLNITASPAVARRINADDYFFVRKQFFYVIASIITIFTLSMFKLKTIRRISLAGFAVIVLLLIMTIFFGFETKGARRWISLFGFSMQASEFMKPVFIIVTAWLLDLGKKLDYFPGMWISLGLYLLIVALLLLQPDIGMTMLFTVGAVHAHRAIRDSMNSFFIIAFCIICLSLRCGNHPLLPCGIGCRRGYVL